MSSTKAVLNLKPIGYAILLLRAIAIDSRMRRTAPAYYKIDLAFPRAGQITE